MLLILDNSGKKEVDILRVIQLFFSLAFNEEFIA